MGGGRPGVQPPDPQREAAAENLLKTPPVVIDPWQRRVIEATIADHCRIRGWELHAVNARTNHIHVVVSAPADPDTVMDQLKAWCSRRLNVEFGRRVRWFTRDADKKSIRNWNYLRNAIRYVKERQ